MNKTRIKSLAVTLLICGFPLVADAQRIQFPSTATTPTVTAYQNPGTVAPAPIGPAPTSPGLGSSIGAWDPYSTAPNTANIYQPPSLAPGGAYPPTSYPPPPSYPPAPASFSGGPSAVYPQQPPPLYTPSAPFAQPNQYQYPNINTNEIYQRFLEHVAFRFTWLPKLKDDPSAFQSHDFDISTTAMFPNFLHTDAPLRVTPAFILHLWNGPSDGVHDMPSKAYSAYLDFSWDPHLTPRLWAELGFRIGVYSDFNTITSRSLRYQGLAVANVAFTPTTTIKGGVVYLDRLKIKLLPVVGVLWQPDNHTRFDITFPYPRLSKYWTTYGDKDLWWYVGGEYGGGSWTIKRYDFVAMDDVNDRVDINDYRVFFGLESTHSNRASAFAEIGYVWERRLVYDSSLSDLKVDNTIMLRTGFKF